MLLIQEGWVKITVAKVDRRILKTQESMRKAVIELMTEKISMTLPFRILPTGQTLTAERFTFIIRTNLICWINL